MQLFHKILVVYGRKGCGKHAAFPDDHRLNIDLKLSLFILLTNCFISSMTCFLVVIFLLHLAFPTIEVRHVCHYTDSVQFKLLLRVANSEVSVDVVYNNIICAHSVTTQLDHCFAVNIKILRIN